MVPTEKFASTIDDPSRGSNATEKPVPPQSVSIGFSSDAAIFTRPLSRKLVIKTKQRESVKRKIPVEYNAILTLFG